MVTVLAVAILLTVHDTTELEYDAVVMPNVTVAVAPIALLTTANMLYFAQSFVNDGDNNHIITIVVACDRCHITFFHCLVVLIRLNTAVVMFRSVTVCKKI